MERKLPSAPPEKPKIAYKPVRETNWPCSMYNKPEPFNAGAAFSVLAASSLSVHIEDEDDLLETIEDDLLGEEGSRDIEDDLIEVKVRRRTDGRTTS